MRILISIEETVCVTEYTSGKYPAYGFLKRVTGVRKGHAEISTLESCFLINVKELLLQQGQTLQYLSMEIKSVNRTLSLDARLCNK